MLVVQVRFEDDVTDDPVAAEEFVDEEDYFQFILPFRTQVIGPVSLLLSFLRAHPF